MMCKFEEASHSNFQGGDRTPPASSFMILTLRLEKLAVEKNVKSE